MNIARLALAIALIGLAGGAAAQPAPDTTFAFSSHKPSQAQAILQRETPFALREVEAASAPQSLKTELYGQIGGATYAVAIQGGYAYIGVGPRLVILNGVVSADDIEVNSITLYSGEKCYSSRW
jgi:hypothetical protein